MQEIIYQPIGIIRSPFREAEGAPIQPSGAKGVAGSVEVFPPYAEGLKDLDGFSHIILIYHFHRSRGYSLQVKPFLDDQYHGLFATRAPRRPNAIGLSVVRLISISENILQIEDVDAIDGSPLLDIKPYVAEFDIHEVERSGWLTDKADAAKELRADQRFSLPEHSE